MFAGFTLNLAAQKVVTGKVTDEEQNPLAGVSVQVKGTSIGVFTDAQGDFRLQIPVDARILTFSFIGMKTQDIEIGSQTSFSIVMQVDVGLLEEVIVIGYGTVKKLSLIHI